MHEKDKALWVHTLWDPLDEMHQSPLQEKEKIIKVAAYCRISEGKTNDHSLENQVSYFSRYIYDKENWKFIGVYMDDQKSGRTIEARTGLKRMLRHATENKIDLILTKNVSRISRNAKDLLDIIEQLKETDTTLYFEAEDIEVSKGKSSLLLETHAAMAQDFIVSTSNLVKFTYKKRIHEGRPYYGWMYGYELINPESKSMVKINEKEAEVVRWIFSSFIDGMTYADISRELTDKGVKTKKDTGSWSGSQISKIINEIGYTGNKITLGRERDLFTNKIKKSKNYKERYLITDNHPGIISMDVYEKAQKRAETVKKKRNLPQKRQENPLKNRLICGRCQRNMRKKGPYVYRCRDSEAYSALCDMGGLTKDKPIVMGLIALFHRFMAVDIEIDKNRVVKRVIDPKNRRGDELKVSFDNMLKEIKKFLIRVNQNDHYEFHRLMYFSKMEMASARGDEENKENTKKEYQAFEKKISRIEEDRKYRDKAISWLNTNRNMEQFLSGCDLEIIRAFMTELTVYSDDAFCVQWVDGKETIMGEDKIPEIRQQVEEKKIKREQRLKEQSELNFIEANKEIYKHEIKKENNKKELQTLYQIKDLDCTPNNTSKKSLINVTKLEPGLSIKDLADLKKNILKSQVDKFKQVENKKLRVAAYCRVSTHLDEQKLSLQTQLAFYTFKVIANPLWELVDVYVDEGLSGKSTEKRDGFNRMVKDVQKGLIDMVITKSVSRFSRNVLDVLETVKMFNDLEHKPFCIFEKEGIRSNDPNATILLSLMAVAAEEELHSLSQSISWGIQNYAKRGIITRGVDIYGYEVDKERNWHIIEKEAKVIKLIFLLYVEGKSIYDILEELHGQGIQSPTGRTYWDYNTLRGILKSEKYMGDYRFQKTYSSGAIDSKKITNKGQLPSIYIEEHHAPIIDKESFQKAQERFEEKRREFGNDKKDGTAGRIPYYKTFTCKHCGELISRYRSTTYDSKEGSAWRCVNSCRVVGATCTNETSIAQTYMDYHFIKTLENIEKNEQFQKRVKSYLSKMELTNNEKEKIEMIKAKMDNLNQKLYHALDLEIQGGKDTKLIDGITSKIIDLREELQHYRNRQEQLEEEQYKLQKLLEYVRRKKTISFRKFHHFRPRLKKEESLYTISNVARDSNYRDLEGEDLFPEEFFKEQVLGGTIDKEGRITYEFAPGLSFGTDLTYKIYQAQFEKLKEKIRFEELLNSKEVLKIKEFCKEGKTPKEIRNHLGITSRVSFDKRILKPLYRAGKLNLKRGKVQNQWWYSWAEDTNER